MCKNKIIKYLTTIFICSLSFWGVRSRQIYKDTSQSFLSMSLMVRLAEEDEPVSSNLRLLMWNEITQHKQLRNEWLFSIAYNRAAIKWVRRESIIKNMERHIGKGPPFID